MTLPRTSAFRYFCTIWVSWWMSRPRGAIGSLPSRARTGQCSVGLAVRLLLLRHPLGDLRLDVLRRGRRGGTAGDLWGRAAHGGADLLQPRAAGELRRRRLDLHHAALDRVLRQLRGPERGGVTLLDLVADVLEGRRVAGRGQLAHLVERLGHLLLHLRLLELAEQFRALGELVLQHHGVALD